MWIFCALPKSETDFSNAPRDVPVVHAGFELKPGDGGVKAAANPKDVENAIAQLQYAYIPLLLDVEEAWRKDYPEMERHTAASKEARRDGEWTVLVTNAKLVLFKPPKSLSMLESDNPPPESDLFATVPWIVFSGDPSIHLKSHQERHVFEKMGAISNIERSIPGLLKDKAATVHIVNYAHLGTFLKLVEDPPRIKKIQINLSINGVPSAPITFE